MFIRYLKIIENLESDEFAVDINISELLVFPAGTEFHEHGLYLSGAIILQDKVNVLVDFLVINFVVWIEDFDTLESE